MAEASTSCELCSQTEADHHLITILDIGSKVEYTIPSFPVFSAVLREMKFQFVDDHDTTSYDGYLRECPDLIRQYPALMKVCSGYTNAFGIEPEEFDRVIEVDDKALYEGLVFVVWKWNWENEQSQSNNEDNTDQESDTNQEEEERSDPDMFQTGFVTHSVVFKCMGTTKCPRSQKVLSEAAGRLANGDNIAVILRKEPTNPKDARAIAFDCKVYEDWDRIGYVVKDVVESVHEALDKDLIVSVNFEWIRFITHWSRSGIGWYCGIKIAKKGEWPQVVTTCGSSL